MAFWQGTPHDILIQFLVEAALLAGSGGILGVMAGIGVTCAAPVLGFWETLISWPSATIAFSFSITVGIIFGIYPALRASRSNRSRP
jgi:ABC-type antimicrobial peptide transport system permease subunit